jgi:hypothetical protein
MELSWCWCEGGGGGGGGGDGRKVLAGSEGVRSRGRQQLVNMHMFSLSGVRGKRKSGGRG